MRDIVDDELMDAYPAQLIVVLEEVTVLSHHFILMSISDDLSCDLNVLKAMEDAAMAAGDVHPLLAARGFISHFLTERTQRHQQYFCLEAPQINQQSLEESE
jgi:hypothetical protein